MKYLFSVFLVLTAFAGFGQKGMLSYEDITYLLQNNIHKADTLLTSKGFIISKQDNDTQNHKFTVTLPGGTYNNISLRVDGKRLFIEIETNEINQYNLIRESISQYQVKDAMVADIQTYSVKNLGTIYISVNDSTPYDPLKRDYDIHIVGDKHITAYN